MKTDGHGTRSPGLRIPAVQKVFAGWMADGRGSPIQEKVLLEIDAQGIRRVTGAPARGGEPDAVDLADCLLIPGLIDSHVHLFMSGTADPARRKWQLDAAYAAVRPVIAHHLAQHLAGGVAAVRDGGDYAAHTLRFRQSEWDARRFPITLHTAGRAWRRTRRYGRLIGRPPAGGQTLAAAIARCPEAVDHVKIVNSGLNSLAQFGKETAPQFSVEELQEAVRLAAAGKRNVMVHANGREPVRRSLAAGCHSIEHGFFMGEENLQRLADSQTFWVPTAVTMQGYGRHAAAASREAAVCRRNLDHQLEQMRRARTLGVRIAAGTDAGTTGVHHGRALEDEIALILSAGFSIPEAIQCATGNGADLMGMDGRGTIAPGCRATLLALPGGPQAFPGNLARPVWFMIDGRIIFDHREPNSPISERTRE